MKPNSIILAKHLKEYFDNLGLKIVSEDKASVTGYTEPRELSIEWAEKIAQELI